MAIALPVSAEAAAAAAEDYLVHEVGDLLMVDQPQLEENGPPRWVFSVTLGNAVRGLLGRVGTIAVDALTGEVLFSEEERQRIAANARDLSRPSAS